MLYVTTRNNRDAYTAQRTLNESRGPDGGLYIPFREPEFSAADIWDLAGKSFNTCVAEMLNTLFGAKLSRWDIDFCIGRYCVRLTKIGQRIVMGECWHNLDAEFSRITRSLTDLIRVEKDVNVPPGNWAEIGIRIAILSGICGEMMREGLAAPGKPFDISVVAGDFSAPISAWYARRWGLPIGNIICCCNENNNLWDFICHGQLRTDSIALRTNTPEADIAVPFGLERLIYACGGTAEAVRFAETCRCGGTYYLETSLLQELRQGIYATVSSMRRVTSVIPNVYGTHTYLLSPYSALAYTGLQDYRSKTGESRYALILAEKSPVLDSEAVASALNVSVEEVKHYFL